jgi:hypothetical protein
MFSVPDIVFKHSAALMYHLFHIYFPTLHGSAVYGHHQVSTVSLKLLHCMSTFRIACKRDISRFKEIDLN